MDFLNIKVYPVHFSIGIFIISFILFFLYLQSNYGSRFFLPNIFGRKDVASFMTLEQYKKFMSKKMVEMSQSIENSENQSFVDDNNCPICLIQLTDFLDCDDSFASTIKNKYHLRLCQKNSDNKIMVTPCGHGFHPMCLLKWYEIRMDCPSCRTPLNLE